MKDKGRRLLLIVFIFLIILIMLEFVSAITGSIGNARIIIKTKPGEIVEKYILIRNVNDVPVRIELSTSGDLADELNLENNSFELQPSEDKKAYFTIKSDNIGIFETRINVLFKTLDGGNGVGLYSVIILNVTAEAIPGFDLNITSPGGLWPIYNKSRLRLTIEAGGKCDLAYLDYTFDYWKFFREIIQTLNYTIPTGGEYRLLCRDCDEYDRLKNFKDGPHFLTLKCLDRPWINTTSFFFIDKKPPKYLRTYPRMNSFTNGSGFMVKYSEEYTVLFRLNVSSSVFYQPVNFSEGAEFCSPGDNKKCYFNNVNLSKYDGQEVEYYFTVFDIGNPFIDSQKVIVKVDTTSPIINSFSYEFNRRYLTFKINVTEKNFDLIKYIDWNDVEPRWKMLCSRLVDGKCIKRIAFPTGEHNIDILVLDKAGNSVEENVVFFI